MPVAALALILTSACLHAFWNYQLKKADCGKELWLLVYLITAAVSLPLIALFDAEAFTRITPTGWLVIALSAPIHVLYAVVLQTGYHKADYSVVYPTARGTGPLITVLAAVVILGNTPSTTGWLGIAAILCGIVLLTLKGKSATEETQHRLSAGLFWGSLTGLFIAGYSFCDAWAVQQETGLTPLTFYFPSIALRAVVLAPFILKKNHWKEEVTRILTTARLRKSLAAVTVGSPGAYLLILYALSLAPLAYVAPAREVGMTAGVIAGAFLLKEKLSLTRLAGIALMVSGVVLIGLSR